MYVDVSVRFEGWDAKLGQPTLQYRERVHSTLARDWFTGIPYTDTKRKRGELYEKKGESKGDPLENG